MKAAPNERAITLDPHDLVYKITRFTLSSREDFTSLRTRIDPDPPDDADPSAVRAASSAPYEAGTILWVREYTFEEDGKTLYSGDYESRGDRRWRSPSAMPRKLARIFLRVDGAEVRYANIFNGGPVLPSWWWDTRVTVLRDRKGNLCGPGPDAVWRSDFWTALRSHEATAPERAMEKLGALIAAGEWASLREHLLTLASTWFDRDVGTFLARDAMRLVRPHRARMASDAWEALVERDRIETNDRKARRR